MKSYLIAVLIAFLMIVPGLMAQDEAELPDEPADGTEVPEEKELNETQSAKADKLAEVSGVSREEIMAMRLGTGTTAPDDTATTGEEPAEEAPQGHGWGVIAKFLGVHPGALGNGTGDKFADKTTGKDGDEVEGGEEEGVIAKRNRARNTRLNGQPTSKDKSDKVTGRDRAREKQKEKATNRERNKDRKEKPDKGDRGNNGRGNKK